MIFILGSPYLGIKKSDNQHCRIAYLPFRSAKDVGDLIEINLRFITFILGPPLLKLTREMANACRDSLKLLSFRMNRMNCWRSYPDELRVYDFHFSISFLG